MPNDITGEAAVASATGSNALGTGPTGGTDPTGSPMGAVTDPNALVNLNNLKQYTLDQLQRLRNFRRPYDQRRAYWYRQYLGYRDRKMYPDNLTPRSNTFVPYCRSNVEAVVSRINDAFFSVDPPLEVRAKGGSDEAADSMQKVMLSVLHRAKWTKAIELFSRDLCIYGHAAFKVDWDWDYDTVTGPEPVFAMQPQMDNQNQPVVGLDGQPVMIPVRDPMGNPIQTGTKMVTKQVPRNCPKIIPIDIYDLLIDPDEKIKAHVCEQSWGEMRRSTESNPDLYLPEAIAELTRRLAQYRDLDRDGVIIRFAEVWDDTKKTVTMVTFGEDADAIGWKDRRYQYRNASYSAYKRRVYNGPPVLLYTGPNPFAHKRIPILDTAYIKVKGDVYGIGLIETISDLNEGVNVFVNMITDNWNMGINRRYAYDVQVDIDHDQLDMGNVPGGKVGVVGNPQNAIYPLPFFTPNAQDYQIIDLYKGMIEMSSGISDFYAKGMGSPTGNRTSSGISQVINESGYVFKLLIRNMELDILQPMMEMVSSMIQQFGTAEMEYSITNAPPGIPKYGQVKLESLVGCYDFDFIAANYAMGKVVKQRNLMAFYNIAMQSPYAVQSEFLREIARAMEIPYANRLLKTEEQVQQEQQASQEQQLKIQLMEKLLDFTGKATVEGIKKKEPNSVTAHAQEVQAAVEEFIRDQAEQEGIDLNLEGAMPVQNQMHEGRPRQSQFEGEIPGGGAPDQDRSFAQTMGSNSLGTAGT
jgi:hypothetical protein